MPDAFISYRRADSAGIAGRIDDHLVARFGRDRIFKDVDSIPAGVNFETYIEDAIRGCAVLLVVIGPRWLTVSSGAFRGRRLDDPADFVRIEVETALRLGVTIIPLLVESASMPAAARLPASLRTLAALNALPVRNDPDFHRDMQRVTSAVERVMDQPRPTPAAVAPVEPDAPAKPPVVAPAAAPVSRPAPAIPKEPGASAGASRRHARGPLIVAVSALVLLTIAVALFATHGNLFGAKALTGPQATASAQASATAAVATVAAQTARLSQPYAPNGPGPCDTNPADPPYTRSGAFWSETVQNGAITCATSGVAELSGQATLGFYGLLDNGHPGFPKAFTLHVLLTMNAFTPDMCATLVLDVSGNLAGASICRNGSWRQFDEYAGATQTGSIPAGTQYVLTLTVTPTTATFAVGSDTLITASISSPITAFRVDMNGAGTNARLDISHFTITPAS